MKTIYIHGLDSSPRPDKIKILESLGLEVEALHIDYRKNPDAYAVLEQYMQNSDIEFIVGSSLGGRLGFYLSARFQIPALLFNPALHSLSLDMETPAIPEKINEEQFFVLGENDQTINPKQTKDFIRKNKLKKNIRLITCHWLAHQIDLRTFEEMSRWAVESLTAKKQNP
ncbi:MAG: YqiA/YcfP family alpha/beta fold hydrolase [Bacteroidota bacterium]|nr:YqiA/YcfP family alpha/beta fold hydrolase [Bacteroidota bacterium]